MGRKHPFRIQFHDIPANINLMPAPVLDGVTGATRGSNESNWYGSGSNFGQVDIIYYLRYMGLT